MSHYNTVPRLTNKHLTVLTFTFYCWETVLTVEPTTAQQMEGVK